MQRNLLLLDTDITYKIIGTGLFAAFCVAFALKSDYNLATGTGNLTVFLFIMANIYLPAKWLRQKFRFKDVQPYFTKLLSCHIWLNTASFLCACIHCYIAMWANDWLRLSLILMGWLTIGGFLMRLRFPPGQVKKGVYLLHAQQLVFFMLIFAMLKGHYVI